MQKLRLSVVLVLLGLCPGTHAQSVTLEQVTNEQVISSCFTVDYNPKVPGTLQIDYVIEAYSVVPVVQSFTTTLDPTQGPYTLNCVVGPVTYIHITLSSADGTIPRKISTWRIHYPDPPKIVGPAAPTGFKVT